MRPVNAITTEFADVNWSIKAFQQRRDFGRSDRRSFSAAVEPTEARTLACRHPEELVESSVGEPNQYALSVCSSPVRPTRWLPPRCESPWPYPGSFSGMDRRICFDTASANGASASSGKGKTELTLISQRT
jgi:hypothetical protein